MHTPSAANATLTTERDNARKERDDYKNARDQAIAKVEELEAQVAKLLKDLEGCGKNSISENSSRSVNHGVRFAVNPVSDRAEISVVLPASAGSATEVNVIIYDMTGNAVFVGATALGRPLIWDLRNQNGRLVANGTYLVAVEAKDRNGRTHVYSARLGVNR